MTIEARRVHRGVSGALLALALVLLATAQVAQADTIYPTNQISGTSFDSGADGFADGGGSCTLLANLLPIVIPEVVCDVTNTHNATDGAGLPAAPVGSIESEYRSAASGLAILPPLSLLEGKGKFRSEPFTIGATGPGTLLFDRRAILDAVLAISGQGNYTITLVNEAGGARTPLVSETLTRTTLVNQVDTGWQTLQAPSAVPVTALESYHLEIDTLFQDQIIVAAQNTFTFRFDNIRFRVADGTGTFVSKPTVFTDEATLISDIDATLNGKVRPEGLSTTYQFRYGTVAADVTAGTATATPVGSVGAQTTLQHKERRILGLTKCTQYFFRIEATNSVGTSVGAVKTFETNCQPRSVLTLPVTGISPTSATFNARINPGGLATTYGYEYRVKAATPFVATAASAPGTIGADIRTDVEPNSVPVGMLTKQITYEVRVAATNALGTVFGNVVEFVTPGTGETGATGPTGPQGDRRDQRDQRDQRCNRCHGSRRCARAGRTSRCAGSGGCAGHCRILAARRRLEQQARDDPHRRPDDHGADEGPQHRPRPRPGLLPQHRGAHMLGQPEGQVAEPDLPAQLRAEAQGEAAGDVRDGRRAARRPQGRLRDPRLQRPAQVRAAA